jgi:hypothetical protein
MQWHCQTLRCTVYIHLRLHFTADRFDSASQDAAESDDSPVHDATGSQIAQLPNAAGSFCKEFSVVFFVAFIRA